MHRYILLAWWGTSLPSQTLNLLRPLEVSPPSFSVSMLDMAFVSHNGWQVLAHEREITHVDAQPHAPDGCAATLVEALRTADIPQSFQRLWWVQPTDDGCVFLCRGCLTLIMTHMEVSCSLSSARL